MELPRIMANFVSQTYLKDTGIRKAIESGLVKINNLTEDQFRPATLDLKIRDVRVYDQEVMFKTAEHHNKSMMHIDEAIAEIPENHEHLKKDSLKNFLMRFSDPTTEFAKYYPAEKDIPIDIPPGAFFEVFVDIEYDPRLIHLTTDLRSSRARFNFKLNSTIPIFEQGRFYIPIWNNNPNTIRLYGDERFTQLFFQPMKEEGEGYIVTNPDEAFGIASKICKSKFEMLRSYIIFNMGAEAYKFKENTGLIDTRNKPGNEELYNICTPPFTINPGESIIAKLEPELELPDDVGIQILHDIPFLQQQGLTKPDSKQFFIDHHVCNGGWVDPGYKGKVTAHPYQYKLSRKLIQGKPLALGRIIKYKEPVETSYNSDKLDSHYQGSDGTPSRH